MSHTPVTCDYKPDNYTFNNFMTILYSFRFRAWIVILFFIIDDFLYNCLSGVAGHDNYPSR